MNVDHILKAWRKEDVDEMLVELLRCTVKEARAMRAEWMRANLSFREQILNLARELDEREGAPP